MADLLLDARGITVCFGGLTAVDGVDATFHSGELVGIIGPNGAGKTTLLKALAGLIGRQGDVTLNGETLPPGDPSGTVKRGLALVAEGRQLFPQMTVTENLELGGWLISKAERAARLEQAFKDFPKLRERSRRKALAVADRGYVLERGSLVAEGPAAELARSDIIRQAYLGQA